MSSLFIVHLCRQSQQMNFACQDEYGCVNRNLYSFTIALCYKMEYNNEEGARKAE